MILLVFLLACFIPRIEMCANVVLAAAVLYFGWHLRSAAVRDGLSAELKQIGPPVEQNRFIIEDFSETGRVGSRIAQNCATPTTIVIDQFTVLALTYLTKFDSAHHASSSFFASPCISWLRYGYAAGDPSATNKVFEKRLRTDGQIWFMYSHESAREEAVLETLAAKYGRVENRTEYVGAGYFQLLPNS